MPSALKSGANHNSINCYYLLNYHIFLVPMVCGTHRQNWRTWSTINSQHGEVWLLRGRGQPQKNPQALSISLPLWLPNNQFGRSSSINGNELWYCLPNDHNLPEGQGLVLSRMLLYPTHNVSGWTRRLSGELPGELLYVPSLRCY